MFVLGLIANLPVAATRDFMIDPYDKSKSQLTPDAPAHILAFVRGGVNNPTRYRTSQKDLLEADALRLKATLKKEGIM
jgi:hypothetical protein